MLTIKKMVTISIYVMATVLSCAWMARCALNVGFLPSEWEFWWVTIPAPAVLGVGFTWIILNGSRPQ